MHSYKRSGIWQLKSDFEVSWIKHRGSCLSVDANGNIGGDVNASDASLNDSLIKMKKGPWWGLSEDNRGILMEDCFVLLIFGVIPSQ